MTFRLQIPRAPRNLWRKMLAQVVKDKASFNMGYWHGYTPDGEYEFIEQASNKKEVKCSTTHCMAGWVTFLTPDGINFEDKIRRKMDKDLDFLEDLSDYARGGDENETALSALLILERSGWSEHINWKHFTTLTDGEALRLIRKMARLEAEGKRR